MYFEMKIKIRGYAQKFIEINPKIN